MLLTDQKLCEKERNLDHHYHHHQPLNLREKNGEEEMSADAGGIDPFKSND